MGGSKNKSPAQKEKAQKRDDGGKKSKKSKNDDSKSEISVLINEEAAEKYIKTTKAITVHDLARHESVKNSTANSFLKKLLNKKTVKRVAGFSGHYIYQAVSE